VSRLRRFEWLALTALAILETPLHAADTGTSDSQPSYPSPSYPVSSQPMIPYSPIKDASPPPAKTSWWSLLHDPQDGKFDMSRWLLQHKGALFVPIIVTEPAVGNGGGVAAVFFQPASQSQESKDEGEKIPPNIYGFGALRTENGTKAFGAAGIFHFADDRWRYKGAIGKASVNLDYYTPGQIAAPRKIGYNLDGIFSLQQVSRRLGKSNWYLSGRWVYMNLNSRLNIESDNQYFKPNEFNRVASGVGPLIEYDSRDNTLTPSSGILSVAEMTFYNPGFGSDNTFQSYRTHTLAYFPLGSPKWILGVRADYRAVRGDVPFYQMPSIDLRGIAYGRYQNQNVAMIEGELRFNVTSRWAALAFSGAGRAWGRNISFDQAETETTEGVGFRYLIARALGLYVGLDSAWGPGEHVYYLQVGSAWR
jgi:hypothetical protein